MISVSSTRALAALAALCCWFFGLRLAEMFFSGILSAGAFSLVSIATSIVGAVVGYLSVWLPYKLITRLVFRSCKDKQV